MLLKQGEVKLLSHNNINDIQNDSSSSNVESNSKSVIKRLDENSILNSEIAVKNELINIKEEPIEDALEFDLNLEYSSDEYLPSPVKKSKRKKKLNYDDNWEPKKPSKVKRNKADIKLEEDLTAGVKRKSGSEDFDDISEVVYTVGKVVGSAVSFPFCN